MGPLKRHDDENGIRRHSLCSAEEEIKDLVQAINILAAKFDALIDSHKTAFRWLLGAVIIIAFGNSKLAENFFSFFIK